MSQLYRDGHEWEYEFRDSRTARYRSFNNNQSATWSSWNTTPRTLAQYLADGDIAPWPPMAPQLRMGEGL